MRQAKMGDAVVLYYTGTLEDGKKFEIPKGEAPLKITLGEGIMVPGFEAGIVGMKKGEKKTITVPPEKGYGYKSLDLIISLSKDKIPEDITPKVGMQLRLKSKGNTDIVARITDITEESVKLDANPLLAGETIIFDIELLDIN